MISAARLDNASIVVTGAAGFVGYHLSRRLLALGARVERVDNLNDYYDPRLKSDRLTQLEAIPGFNFVRADLATEVLSKASSRGTSPTTLCIWRRRRACVTRWKIRPLTHIQTSMAF